MNYYRWFSTDKDLAETIKEPGPLQTPSPSVNLIEENVKRAVSRVPNGHILYNLGKFEPHVKTDFDVSVTQLDNEKTLFEVTLRTRVGAKKLTLPLTDASLVGAIPLLVFEADVSIAGIFEIVSITDDQLDRFLQHECPTMLFPRAQKLIAALTRNMGYASIVIQQSQFIRIRERKIRKAQPNVHVTGNA